MDIDRGCGRSLTDQLVDALRVAVRLGRWKEGERLPTREELMASCGVSRNVVQAAVRRLVAEGLVVTRPRLGCIVARPSRRPVRGVVLEIDTSSGVPYGNACFSAAFQRALASSLIGLSCGCGINSSNKIRPPAQSLASNPRRLEKVDSAAV